MASRIRTMFDGLANALTGAGTTADKRAHAFYAMQHLDPAQIEAAYRSSWLMRKVVDRPPSDMTRAWRDWQAEKPQIEAIEAEEKRIGLRDKVKHALVLGRLGGGAIILGAGQGDPALPLNLRGIGKQGLRYAHVVSRWQIGLGQLIGDPESEYFGQPEYFELSSGRGGRARIHPSRVVAFRGLQVPHLGAATQDQVFWGDSIVQAISEAVKNADSAQGGIASLIDEAKVDWFGFNGLNGLVATSEGEERVMRRLEIMQAAKSIHRAAIGDTDDKWEQRQITWTGIPEVVRTFLSIVAGAADIPATILLGKSPDGMNATGDADFRAYYDSISSRQDTDLRPALEKIDAVLLPSALGSTPADAYFEFSPLWQMDEAQTATVMKTKAEAVKIYVDSGLIPDEALGKAVQNMLVEDGSFPGLDAALDELPDMPEPDADEPDPSALQAANENEVEGLQRRGAITADQAMALITDARPRSLYVQRKVVNADEIIRWAKAQGFETTLAADDLHVTVCFSRSAVDWMKLGSSWSEDEKGQVTIPPGGARLIERFDGGAVVLLFSSSSLSWRHEEFKRAGASHDFGEYQPHFTITYNAAGMDLDEVEPYRGRIVLGPEIFDEVDEGWKNRVSERSLT